MVRIIVDGSNFAPSGDTGKRSFAGLLEGMVSLKSYEPDSALTIVTDANLMYQISDAERAAYKKAVRDREIFPAPAGTEGRGDGWIIAIANAARMAGQEIAIASNDSFTEFRGENAWLSDVRMIGGGLVDGVGWVWCNRKALEGRDSRPAERLLDDSEPGTPLEASMPKRPIGTPHAAPTDVTTFEPSEDLPPLNSILEGVVKNIVSYGVFVSDINSSYEGLMHRSTFGEELTGIDATTLFHTGETVFAVVIGYRADRHEGRNNLILSYNEAVPISEFDPAIYGYTGDDPAGLKSAEERWRRHIEWMAAFESYDDDKDQE